MLTEEDIKKLIEAQKEVFPVKADLGSLKSEFDKKIDDKIDNLGIMIKNSFDNVERRLDRIEDILIKDHEMRIKRMEDALVIK